MKWWAILLIILFALLLICFIIGYVIWRQAMVTAKPETYIKSPTDDPREI